MGGAATPEGVLCLLLHSQPVPEPELWPVLRLCASAGGMIFHASTSLPNGGSGARALVPAAPASSRAGGGIPRLHPPTVSPVE
eukprot:scaffold25648_cov124-Isochrysis_galbana.AAC.1